MKIALVFPHQLFENHPAIKTVDNVYLLEDQLYFKQYKFHKQKLILHRASMKFYADYLSENGKEVHYVNYDEHQSLDAFIQQLKKNHVAQIEVVDPTDFLLKKRLTESCDHHEIELSFHTNPNFYLSPYDLKKLLKKRKNGYFMASFYKDQRKRLDILMEGDEPVGGQWSFDEDNRKKLPKNHECPELPNVDKKQYVEEAEDYVEQHFSTNYGEKDQFIYPVTFQGAKDWLDEFLASRMKLFGDYEDAISTEENYLYHSVLTPMLNIGLLNPQYVIERTLDLHDKHDFPLNSLEGFIRQIIGWREFMRGIYELEGVFERTNNHFNHKRNIPESFWKGTTGIEPVDHVINKVLKTSYSHHIERLMIMGNFMLLCEFDPDDIYRWFMEMYIDAYDWVMVPNVYGMTQYADGGLITTKPYISSSNYIRKMSNFKKGPWCDVWDGLYWRFIKIHEKEFAQNQRMSMMISLLNRMDKKKLQRHIDTAEEFLNNLS